MDAYRFDALARALSAPGTRRRTLAAVVSSALGVLAVGPAAVDEARARKKPRNKDRKDRGITAEGPCGNGSARKNRCKRDRQCCTNYCKKGRCRCRKLNQSCTEDRNCCPERTGRTCIEGACQTRTCLAQGTACPSELSCCMGLSCQDNECQPPLPTCLAQGTACPGEAPCCAGLICQDNACQPQTCAETCQDGCCAGPTCEAGTTTDACGANGETCQVCAAGLQCLQGICDCGTGTVCAVGCPYSTLQAAIDDPDGPGAIELCATTFAGPFTISRDLTITGAGAGEDGTILDGQGSGSTVTINDGVTATLQGLRITGGSGNGSNDGGGIDNHGDLTLTSCTVTGNHVVDNSGGIHNGGSATLALVDSTVTDNTAGDDGGGIFIDGMATLTNSLVTLNMGGGDGGGIYNVATGQLSLTDSRVTDNTAEEDGGGIHNTGDVSFLGSSCLENNEPGNCIGTVTCPVCMP